MRVYQTAPKFIEIIFRFDNFFSFNHFVLIKYIYSRVLAAEVTLSIFHALLLFVWGMFVCISLLLPLNIDFVCSHEQILKLFTDFFSDYVSVCD